MKDIYIMKKTLFLLLCLLTCFIVGCASEGKPLKQENTANAAYSVTDDRGKTLLDYAIQFHNNDIFELLIKSYINVNIKDNLGNTAIHYAVINNKLGYLKTLLQIPNVDPKVVNNTGHSPLYLACLYGREQMVLLFLHIQLERMIYNVYNKINE